MHILYVFICLYLYDKLHLINLGKTLAYVWPMIVHIIDQPQMQVGDGPVGVILSPTRELAAQIYTEVCLHLCLYIHVYNVKDDDDYDNKMIIIMAIRIRVGVRSYLVTQYKSSSSDIY